jgi:hypothetical protein
VTTWEERQAGTSKPNSSKAGTNSSTPPPGVVEGLDLSGAPAPKRRPDLIRGLLGAGRCVAMHGAKGTAKSLILEGVAVHVAAGEAWCGREVKQAGVVYISPSGREDVEPALAAQAELLGRQLDELPLRFWGGPIDDPDHVAETIEAGMAEGCGLVVLDVDHEPHDPLLLGALATKLRAKLGCAVIITARQAYELDGLGADAVWSTPQAAQAHLAILQVEHARAHQARGRITFRLTGEEGAAVAVETSERPTLRPQRLTSVTVRRRPRRGMLTDQDRRS